MTRAEQFQEYAKEATGWSYNSISKDEKQALIRLASTWARAAMYRETNVVSPPEHDLAA